MYDSTFSLFKHTKLLIVFVLFCIISIDIFAKDTLTIGIFPRRNVQITNEIFQPLKNHLEQEIGIKIVLKTPRNFEQFWLELEKQQYDLVHLNQYHYVKLNHLMGYEVILKNEEFNEDTLKGAIYVRKDSGISKITDLEGKKIVFGGGKTAFISHIVIQHLFLTNNMNPDKIKSNFAINPPNAIGAVYFKQADAGVAGNIGIKLPVIKKLVDTSQLKILAESDSFPHIPWAVHPDIPATLREKITDLLVNLKNTDKGKSILKKAKLTGFSIANDTEYNRVRVIIAEVLNEHY